MHNDEARQWVGTGWGIAQIASTVKDLGHEISESNLALRVWAGDRERRRTGGGLKAARRYYSVGRI